METTTQPQQITQPTITIEQAITNIDQACSVVPASRQDHANLMLSVKVLAAAAKRAEVLEKFAPAEVKS